MQSKKTSIIESVTNTVIGLVTSFIIQIIIYPAMDIEVTINQNVLITIIFFTVSIIRGYFVRRFFNLKSIQNDNRIHNRNRAIK